MKSALFAMATLAVAFGVACDAEFKIGRESADIVLRADACKDTCQPATDPCEEYAWIEFDENGYRRVWHCDRRWEKGTEGDLFFYVYPDEHGRCIILTPFFKGGLDKLIILTHVILFRAPDKEKGSDPHKDYFYFACSSQ